MSAYLKAALDQPGVFTQMQLPDAFIAALRAVMPKEDLLLSTEEVTPYECDGLSDFKEKPLAVVLPRTEAQVVAILKACQHYRVPIVPRGGGTGLSGGAQPHKQGIVIALNRFKRMDILPELMQTIAGVGCTNLSISQEAAPLDLFYAPDPSSQLASTIGGNIAENAGGVHCVKYGITVQNVHAIRVVTAAGDVLQLGEGSLDQPGYDLMALMTGSEGLLGLITEARLRLLPTPPAARVLLAFFSEITRVADAVYAIRTAGVTPSGLEVMDRESIRAANSYNPGLALRTDAEAALLCELDGEATEIEDATRVILEVLQACGATEVRHANSEDERLTLWSARKAGLPALLRISKGVYLSDCTVPIRALSRVLVDIYRMADEYGIKVAQCFHAGDGNLHPIVVFDPDIPGQAEKAHELVDRLLQIVVREGGSISGEHGVGNEKSHAMCWQFSAAELEIFRGIKNAFDPDGILNPGKLIPTLHRCAEFGGMHLRSDENRFPDLPRF